MLEHHLSRCALRASRLRRAGNKTLTSTLKCDKHHNCTSSVFQVLIVADKPRLVVRFHLTAGDKPPHCSPPPRVRRPVFVSEPEESWREARRYLTWLLPKYLRCSNRQKRDRQPKGTNKNFIMGRTRSLALVFPS